MSPDEFKACGIDIVDEVPEKDRAHDGQVWVCVYDSGQPMDLLPDNLKTRTSEVLLRMGNE